LGRWEQAIAHFDKAVQLDPESPATVCSRGDLYADMGRYGEALADYAQAIELDPEFAHAYRNGAWLLATCPDPQYRDPENAILGAQQALEYSYGDRHVSLDTLAAALASSGQFTAAIDALTEAVDLAPAGAASAYLARLELYESHQPFLNEAAGGQVAQVAYEAEASDQ
jgi:serine/threonine-protein kinase